MAVCAAVLNAPIFMCTFINAVLITNAVNAIHPHWSATNSVHVLRLGADVANKHQPSATDKRQCQTYILGMQANTTGQNLFTSANATTSQRCELL